MQYLVGRIAQIKSTQDRNYLAIQCLHPLRPEEVLGLRSRDVDTQNGVLRIREVVTHPDRNQPIVKPPKTEESMRDIDLVLEIISFLTIGEPDEFLVGGQAPLTYQQVRRMCERIQKDTGFTDKITPRRFRPTVLTDLYDQTKDIKATQYAAGHTTSAMTLEHYVKGRNARKGTAAPIASVYGIPSTTRN